ncbi:MAG: hypothetical protein J5968_06260 [Oscillospiraceae bacterium]|nr:hypothetical protein [Oscillospiraceae bacterium]MBP1556847.1 hypothetical protein [Oscillospiraceae bacterium]
MDCDKAWEAFFKSGLVNDYLIYVGSVENKNEGKTPLKGENGRCEVPPAQL